MFLLLNRLLIIIFLFSLSLYFPYLSYYGVDLTPNFILIIMTLVGLKTDKKISTIFGFFMGLIQDLTTQYLSLGFLTLLGPCFGYGIGNIKIIKDIRMRYILIFISFFIYFWFSFMVTYSESYFFYFKFSLIKTVLTIFIFFLLRKIFINSFKAIEK